MFLEGIRNLRQENQANDDMLILGGIHVAAQLVRRLPKFLLEAKVRLVA